jgi:hypothetical protein
MPPYERYSTLFTQGVNPKDWRQEKYFGRLKELHRSDEAAKQNELVSNIVFRSIRPLEHEYDL